MFPVDGRVTSYWNYLYLVRKKRSIDEIFFHSKKLMEAQSELHGMWFVIMCNILKGMQAIIVKAQIKYVNCSSKETYC
jgi:hypothetical protein